jgi:protein STE50
LDHLLQVLTDGRSYRGDTFIILSRAKGWWVVQRDPNGTGIVDADIVKQGWVPAGCLLETKVPVASAIAEAAAKGGAGSKTPILPLSIISTSFPGIALMDYRKKGDEELDLNKDDLLRVFKRYNHWSYVSLGFMTVRRDPYSCHLHRPLKRMVAIVAGYP